MRVAQNSSTTWAACAVALVLLGSIAPAHAQEEERQRLLARIQQVTSSSAAHKAALEAGKQRSVLCGYCHGEDGNSKKPEIPNLAGQNPAYLLQQVEKFADGRRKNFVMQNLAKDFTMEDKVNLALYFGSQKVNPEPADAALAARGKELFGEKGKNCQRCHGADGHGEAGYARIAGQKQTYVEATLKRFRENANATGRDKDEVKRTNEFMEMYTQFLSDTDIQALAAYIATLRPGQTN